ncbi:MAG: Gfo/Idh/MocA family oxidoreductase [Propionibacteriaceae bacterium]|nr:Gfo/Idh/MocA family oxidoreductase [Propionibacteriaceae bacterium]
MATSSTAIGPVRFGMIGLGWYGSSRCELLSATEGVALTAVADLSQERARAHGQRYDAYWTQDYRELLARPDVDVVAVFVPSGLHLDVARAAAAAGKHVLTTKPIEISENRATAMVDACRDAGVQLFCEFFLRYQRQHFQAREAIGQGLLGDLILGEFSWKGFRSQQYWNEGGGWRRSLALNGGGLAMNQLMHTLDMMRWTMGDPVNVKALAGRYLHDIEGEDTLAALFTTSSGATAVVTGTTTYLTPRPDDFDWGGGSTTRLDVSGTKGSLRIVDNELDSHRFISGELPDAADLPANVFVDVAATLRDPTYTSPALASGEDARDVVRIAMALYRAAETGKDIALQELASSRPDHN